MLTRDFQIKLIVHLAKDPALFAKVRPLLQLSDLDLSACQLIWESLIRFHDQFNRLPHFDTLQSHVLYVLQNVDGATLTRMLPEEYPALAHVMSEISGTAVLDSEYYYSCLPAYLKSIRISRATESFGGLHAGQNAEQFISVVRDIDESVKVDTGIKIDGMLTNPEPRFHQDSMIRIPTMLPILNDKIDNGLGRGECGMIVACPGVGKTTGLINFLDGCVASGKHALFLTLELTAVRIKHRYQAITAGIPAQYFKRPVTEWPEALLRMYDAVLDPIQNPMITYPSIVDLSKSAPTIAQINETVSMWKEQCYKNGGDPDKECVAVFVDWLDKIDPRGIARCTTQTKDDRMLTLTSEALAEVGRKQNVAMWTATQANRDGDGREKLDMRHTAYAYHKHDAMDLSIGFGVVDAAELPVGPADTNENACSRSLIGNIMKNRDNPTGSFEFYQGSTLRFWNTESVAAEEQRRGKEDGYAGVKQVHSDAMLHSTHAKLS